MGGSIVIKNGLVIDGTGTEGKETDVLIRGGTIAEIGPGLSGDKVVDARGAVVAPGFIDMHTHYDAQLFWDPLCSQSSWHGVTTAIIGNCGYGLAPCSPEDRDKLVDMMVTLEDIPRDVLEEGIDWSFTDYRGYRDAIETLRPSLNIASYIGHSPVRIAVMGDDAFERGATEDEVARMAVIVQDAMQAGAVGFATSASPTGRRSATKNASFDEMLAMGKAMASGGYGVYMTVPGGVGTRHSQMYEMQREIGRPVTWTALMQLPDGSHRELIDMHLEHFAQGYEVYPQVSCRPLVAATTLRRSFALRTPCMLAIEGVDDDIRLAKYLDTNFRDQTRVEEQEMRHRTPWNHWTISSSPSMPGYEDLTVQQLADSLGKSPIDALFDLVAADNLDTRFTVKQTNYDQKEVAQLLGLGGAVLGLADSGAHPDQIFDYVLPTDFLSSWVREKQIMPLEKAVRKLTGELADLYGFERGYLREGMPADITVFDPDTIAPGPTRMVNDLPAGGQRIVADQTRGLNHVFVNGTPIRQSGEQVRRPAEGGSGASINGRLECSRRMKMH